MKEEKKDFFNVKLPDENFEENKHVFNYDSILTDENVYYVFQRLITPVVISMCYERYKDYWDDFNSLFGLLKNCLSIYYNYNSLSQISSDILDNMDSLIVDLKFNCLGINTIYIEEIDIWFGEFMQLYYQSIQ